MAYRELSTHPLSNIPRGEIQLAAAGSWDHGAYRSSGRLDTGSKPCLGGRNRKCYAARYIRRRISFFAAGFVERGDLTNLPQPLPWRSAFACWPGEASSAAAAIWA